MSPNEFAEIGKTKEECLAMIKNCEIVRDTIQFRELELLWYIRNLRRGDFNKFNYAAKINYEAVQAYVNLVTKNDLDSQT